MKTEKQMAAAAAEFAKRWEGRGYEKGDSQPFWFDLLSSVFGVETPSTFIRYEEQVKVDKTNFIDGHIRSTKVLIEQKSIDKDLRLPVLQSDGSKFTPFQQAKRYIANMPLSEHPRWVVTCNFQEFLVYDMEQSNGEPEQILLANLGKEYYRLQFLVNEKSEHIKKEERVSMEAGQIVGRIYDALKEQYADNSPQAQRWLNILCVRLVFCLYAEDAGIFSHDQFCNYLSHYEADDFRNALIRLFDVLKSPEEKRSKYLKDDLKAFPYTNGGLFEEEIEIPQFTEQLRDIIIHNASLDFDWSEISPTIFGAVFESTLNPDTRRSGGMHYTSIENIHKVIDPLFLNDLRQELDTILEEKVEKKRVGKLAAYQDKLASLTFLDPACGSGNFLTETYLSLRRLENEVIREMYHGQGMIGEFLNPIKVNINQFYGIEINDFAVTVATTALWISESQMLTKTEHIIHKDIDFLPLKSYTNIKEGNALRENWNLVECPYGIPDKLAARTVPAYFQDTQADRFIVTTKERPEEAKEWKYGLLVHYNYIMGNPPFVGARQMSKEQKEDVLHIFGEKWKNVGNLDYVCCWYMKAFQSRQCGGAKVAFVSTNSICQGEQVANLWKPLMERGLCIDFAHRTFRWDSEATIKAHVHCVIVGFSRKEGPENWKPQDHIPGITSLDKPQYDALTDYKEGTIFDNDKVIKAKNINPYLLDAPNVFVESRIAPLCDVPWIKIGNKPIDGGNYLFTKEEMEDFIKVEPKSAKYFKLWYGSEEFIHQKPRYCLWLGHCSPAELRTMPHCLKRVEAVRDLRLASVSAGTQKLAERPTRFHVENMPDSNFIIIPKVSSEKRRYIPMGFMSPDALASDLVFVLTDANLYHFGVLQSNVHMAWVRAVCGRLEMRYRYSKDIVYNNFPWPKGTVTSYPWSEPIEPPAYQAKIEKTAQAILDARALYPDSSLADLYDDLTMPVELRKAHQDNDRAVMEAYGWKAGSQFTESMCVAELFKLYSEKTK